MKLIKNILKGWLLFYRVKNKFNPSIQIGQIQLVQSYKKALKNNLLPKLSETGFSVFSQFEEDGMLLYLFSIIGMDNKQFIEIGSNDGINSNCANLFFNFGWYGLFIDSDIWSINRGKRFYKKYPNPWQYKPTFCCSKVSRENINQIIQENNFSGTVGLLSIDIDGNDYWIWDALTVVEPLVVIIETHNEFGLRDIVVPYDPDSKLSKKHPLYHGASPVAMVKLARRKGYRLVGANNLGFNFIFVKDGIADNFIPEVSVEDVLKHPSVAEGQKLFEEIKDWHYLPG